MALWDDLTPPWQCCLKEAWDAYCAGSLPIGAAITDQTGQILACGRNRTLEHSTSERQLTGIPLAHAELNALIAADYTLNDRHTWVLYTTTEPCPLCIGAIRMSGIGEVRYASHDVAAGSVELLKATAYMRRRAIEIVGPENVGLEVIVAAMYVEHGLLTNNGHSTWVLAALEQTVPDRVAFGRALFEAGTLRGLRDLRSQAADVVNEIAVMARSHGLVDEPGR